MFEAMIGLSESAAPGTVDLAQTALRRLQLHAALAGVALVYDLGEDLVSDGRLTNPALEWSGAENLSVGAVS